jgi:hypothetical protein
VLLELYRHVFVYLVTSRSPMDFGLFLLRLYPVPRTLPLDDSAAVPASALEVSTGTPARRPRAPCNPARTKELKVLEWLFPERRGFAEPGAGPADQRYLATSKNFSAPGFKALYRRWQEDPANTLWVAGSNTLADAVAALQKVRKSELLDCNMLCIVGGRLTHYGGSCSSASRLSASLRPRAAGLTALTPAARELEGSSSAGAGAALAS